MKKGLKSIIIVIVILAVVAVLGRVAYFRYEDKLELLRKKGSEKLEISTPVAVYSVKNGSISESLVLNGDIVPIAEVNIFSTVPGKVKDILVKEGDTVEKGSVLVYIDRSEAGLTFAPTPVESTIDGIVKRVMAENGAYSTPQTPLFQIINMDYVEFVVRIPEKNIYKIRKGLGAEMRVISYPDKIFYGRISKLSPVVDPVSRTLEARIGISNKSHRLKPGMFGEVKIIMRKKKDALIIPLSAVIDRDGRDVVFTVKDGKAFEVKPEFDIKEGDRISVLNGLSLDDRVIVIGQHNVNSGDKVNITEEIE